MTNSTTLVKKAFSVAVAATTILWSVGLSAFLPTTASAASFGDLIKGTSLSTVYYYGSNGQRYAFPNEKTYFSWYKDFSTVKTISDSELASITLAGNIVYRPGARWIKITSDKKVYVVSTSGKVRWVENEATAKGLGGDNWNAHIDDVPDVFFTDYTVGDSLTTAASGYDGMLWSDASGKYLVAGTKYQKVTDAGFAANGYNAGFVLAGTGFTKSGLTAGAEVTAKMANLTDAAQKVTTPTYAVSQNVSVALSASSPASSTIVASQALANLAAFDFTNPTASAVSVKSLKVARVGVSSDTTLSNVYLFNGYTRLTDAASVSSGSITWNDASGIFTIPAGGTSTVYVRSDIASASGQTVGVKLAAASDVTFTGAFAAAGTFPISGAVHTIAAAPSTFATAYLGTTPTPSSDTAPAPQSDLKLWEDTLVVGTNTNGAKLYSIRFRNTGSIAATDVSNWRLYVAGTQRGTAVASQDANGYITFDLSASPISLTTNTHTVKVIADVVGGSSRTVSVGLRSAADVFILDADYMQPMLVTITNTSTAFSARNASAQTIASGSVSFSKRTDTPATDVVNTASGVTLARYDVKAAGEAMKIESLNFNFIHDDEDSNFALRNGAIFADGAQIGNTTALCNNDTSTASTCTSAGNGSDAASYTTFNFGSSLVVYPGTPVLLEVKADIYDSVGNNSLATDDTIQVVIDGSSSNNVLRKVTGTYDSYPASDVPAGIVTVKTGALTVSKNSSYASQSFVAPKTSYKIGSFAVTSSSAESLNITGFTVDLDGSSGEATEEISNLYVKYGPASNMVTSVSKTSPSVADAGNVFSVDSVLAPNSTIFVDVYADLQDQDTNDTIITTLIVASNAVSSGGAVSQNGNGSAVTGQTISLASGTFTSALDGSTPVNAIVAGNQTVSAAKYRFSAANETYTIKELQLSIPSGANTSGVPASVEIWDGGSGPLGSAVFNLTSGDSVANGAANITGLNITVAANSYKILTAKLVLNEVGFGAGTSQTNAALSLDVVKAYNSSGTLYTTAAGYTTDRDGNELYVFKSIPTVNAVDLTNSTVVNGQATDLYKFTVTASANGSVALKQFKLSLNWSDGSTADTLEVESLKLYKNGANITAIGMVDEDGNTVTSTSGLLESDDTLVVSFTDEDVISAGETVTYTVRGTPQGFRTVGGDAVSDSVSMYLVGDTATNGTKVYLNNVTNTTMHKLHTVGAATNAGTAYNFIWSDVSAQSHVGTSGTAGVGDWHNGYLVLNLDLAAETWSK